MAQESRLVGRSQEALKIGGMTHKDQDLGTTEWVKHTRNTQGGKAKVNRKRRHNAKQDLNKKQEATQRRAKK